MTEVNATQKLSAADELKSLVNKFLESQDVATKSVDTKQVDVPQPSTNVLIGVPCFGGSIQHQTVNLLMSLSSSLSNAKIPHQTHFVAGESLIMRARNYLASVATFSHDNAGRAFSHLMFIDADICFHPEYFFKMLKANLFARRAPARCSFPSRSSKRLQQPTRSGSTGQDRPIVRNRIGIMISSEPKLSKRNS